VDVTSLIAAPARVQSQRWLTTDNFVATATYADGSVCTLVYTSLGNRRHPKESLDVFCDGCALRLDDYRSLTVTGCGKGWRRAAQHKGHLQELEALATALRNGAPWPIPLEQQVCAMRSAFAVERSIGAR
jgi:predicted dehydrogenase